MDNKKYYYSLDFFRGFGGYSVTISHFLCLNIIYFNKYIDDQKN